MGYYGRSIYRGDFRLAARRVGGGIMRAPGFHPAMLRGDWLSDLGDIAGKVGGYIDKGLEYAPLIGKVVKAYDTTFAKTVAPAHPALGSPQVGGGGLPTLPALPGRTQIQVVKQKGMRGGTPDPSKAQKHEDFHDGGGRRRMNVLNVKALRRSLRRADGFLKVAKKFVRVLKPGHHVELKPHHKHKR